MQTIGYSSLAVCFGAVLLVSVLAPQASLLSRALTSGWLMAFGRYSYAIYLFHAFLTKPLWSMLSPLLVSAPDEMTWLARGAYILTATGITFVLAVLSWNVFERHFLRLKDRFPYESRERSTLLPAP